MKKGFILLLVAACIVLSGCRERSTALKRNDDPGQHVTGEQTSGGILPKEDDAVPDATGNMGSENNNGYVDNERTVQNPEAKAKQYDETAEALIVPGSEVAIHKDGERGGSPFSAEEQEKREYQQGNERDRTALQRITTEHAQQKTASQYRGDANSVLLYYNTLLQDRFSSQFECKKLSLYFEGTGEYLTCHRASEEHTLILNSGCQDVSARLLPENLTVNDGWIERKNPGVIVKLVSEEVLGFGRTDTQQADRELGHLLQREGLERTDAVKNKRVLVVSETMLTTPALRTALMLLIAKTANPSLFEDVNMEDALQALLWEAYEAETPGIFYYAMH